MVAALTGSRTSKILSLLSLCVSLSALCGCSSFQKWVDDHPRPRVFNVDVAWVRQGPTMENLRYRKLHRMIPLVYTLPEDGKNPDQSLAARELVIEGNGTDSVVAYRRDTGAEFWRIRIPNGVEAPGTLINDRLFVGGLDGQLYSIQVSTGEVVWSFPTRAENLSEPLIFDGQLYVQSGNNTVYALDAATGKQLWLYSRQDTNSLSIRGGSKPTVRNGTLYVGFSDGFIVALVLNNGALKWEKQLNKNKKFKDIDSNPLVDGEFLYVAGYDDHLYALRAATGEMVWKSDRGGWGNLTVVGDRLYYATSSGEIRAVDKTTGQKVWSYELKDGVATAPTLYKGLLVFGESQGQLRFLDSGTGRVVASYDPGKGGILSQVGIDEKAGRVYFISGEANVYGMNANWGYAPATWLR